MLDSTNIESSDVSTLRIVSKRDEDEEPYTVNIPVKENKFSLVLPEGYIEWPKGKPFPEPIRVQIDETKNLWLNFGVSNKHGFYVSLNVSENGED